MSQCNGGGRDRTTRAACDECEWEGASSAAARRHHEQTGHTCWAQTMITTFYGDPIEAWAKREGMTMRTPALPGGQKP
jgi:hypothetical protein